MFGFFQSAFPLWGFYLWFFPWRVLGSIPPKLCSLLSVLPQLSFSVRSIVHVSVNSCVCMDIMCTVCVDVYDVCVGVYVCGCLCRSIHVFVVCACLYNSYQLSDVLHSKHQQCCYVVILHDA